MRQLYASKLLKKVIKYCSDIDSSHVSGIQEIRSRDVSDYVAGYIGNKLQESFHDCCGKNIVKPVETSATPLLRAMHYSITTGGLKTASADLNQAVAKSFAIVDATS